MTSSELPPIATAEYGTYVPLGSVTKILAPFLSTPAIINATPNGRTPEYCVN